jgi:hypothetical protein
LKDLPLNEIGEYTKDSIEYTVMFTQALKRLPCGEWKVFTKDPSSWKKAMRQREEIVAEQIRLYNLYEGYDPKYIDLVKDAFR